MKRLLNPVALVALVVFVGVAALIGAQLYSSSRATDAQAQANTLADQVAAACAAGGQSAARLTRIGACRTASDVHRAPVVADAPTSARGVAGAPGSAGAPGATGATGASGVPGVPGATGARGPAGPVGKPGDAGKDGTNGAAGVDGAPGVNGDTGPAGPAGPAGVDGKDGTNGQDGKDGTNGEPPAGWQTTRADGTTETCVRAADFDPHAPRYTCSTSTTPPTTTTAPGG